MKKILLLVAIMLCCAMSIFAQNDKISYQAVVRDTTNRLVANQTVTVTVNIFNGEETTAVYSETHENVQTNVNGLISLLIGPDQTDDAWNSIQWANARVETKVTLDGVLLGTLVMPLTAVPYALYADEINPAGTVVTNIYDKMQRDSIALAGQITNLDSKLTSKIHEDSVALANKMSTDSLLLHNALIDSIGDVREALKDSVGNINTRMENMANALHSEITTLDNKLTDRINVISDSVKTNYENIALNRQAIIDSTAHIRTEIDTTSKAIRNTLTTTASAIRSEVDILKTNVTNRMNTISDSVKTNYENIALNRQAIIDSTAHIRTEIDTTSKAIRNTLTTTASAIRNEVDTKLQSYAQLNGDNAFSGDNTFSGTNTFTGTVNASSITASSVTVSCGNTTLDICTMYNELTNLIAGLNNTIDSLKGVITELLPSLSLKGKTDTMFTNGNTVNVTYTADFSNANSTDYTFHWTVDGTSVNSTSNPYTHPYATIGTHKVVCTATRTGYATLTDSITTTIRKGTPVVTAPTAKNLTYNTNAQTLVNAGSTTGGTLYYIVTNTNSKPDANASGWSTTLPQGTNAGTYYVWYKVVGGDNYNNVDVSNTSVAVNIAKAALSSLSVSMNDWTYGQTAQNPSVSGNTGNGAVTYSYKKSTDNTYTSTKPSNAGNYTVKASVAETGNYNAGTATKDFTINKAAGSISYSTTSVTKNVGDANFTIQLTNTGDGTVTYSISNNGSDCSINSSGLVAVGNSAGTATITATVTDGTNYSYATNTATYTLTVQAADPIVVNSTFQYCYDCQRNPAYPVSGSTCTLSGFGNPTVGNHTSTGPWKLEYKGSYSSNDNPYNISLDYYKSMYSIQSVPIFELFQWDEDQNKFVSAAYGVVCAYSNVTGNVDHTAFFEATNHWGCYLTGQSHSSSISLTFDEYMSSGLNSLIPQP